MLRRIHRNWFALVAMIVAGGATGAAAVAASPPPQAPRDPYQLFTKMLPAIRHDRCTNCHGVVDPRTGRNHDGGIIPADTADPAHLDCTTGGCHELAKEWQIPGDDHFFAGRTDRQVCAQLSDFVTFFGKQPFIDDHAKKDEQILHAFKGFAAGARDTADKAAAPPPMSHARFVQAVDDWVNKGDAACDLTGEITVEEGVSSAETVHPAPNATIRMSQTGTRHVKIKGAAGRFTATITVDGEIITQSVTTATDKLGQPCTVTQTIRDQYSGSTTGPAGVVIKDTLFRTRNRGETDYRIDVMLPDEKTRRTQVTTIQDGCGIGLTPPPNDIQDFDWPQWEFSLEGFLADARVPNAIGGCAKTVMWDNIGKDEAPFMCNRFGAVGNAVEPWLVNHGANNSFQTGKPIPFRIATTWNLRRR